MEPEELLAGHPEALDAFRRVSAVLDGLGDYEIRTTKSQITFRGGRRGFAYLWRPGQWLSDPDAEVVLSIAAPRRIRSDRFKEVVHPSARVWMHHLELHDPGDLDDEVRDWLAEAMEAAGTQPRGRVASRRSQKEDAMTTEPHRPPMRSSNEVEPTS
jgi:hypothetical protein